MTQRFLHVFSVQYCYGQTVVVDVTVADRCEDKIGTFEKANAPKQSADDFATRKKKCSQCEVKQLHLKL